MIRRDISQPIKERLYQAAFVCLILFAGMVIFNDVMKVITRNRDTTCSDTVAGEQNTSEPFEEESPPMKIRPNSPLALLAGLLLLAGSAAAQQPVKTTKQLTGRWQIVSVTLEQNGDKTDYFGPNPQGITIFDGTSHFMRVLSRSELPKFASINRAAGTPEENKAVVQGSIAYAGTYKYNTADKSWTLHIEETTFPNWLGVIRSVSTPWLETNCGK